MQLAALLGLVSCTAPYWERRSGPRFADIDAQATVIKLHLPNGEAYVLSSWRIDSARRSIVGTGEMLAPTRASLRRGVFEIPLSSVAMFESNRHQYFTSTGVVTTSTLGVFGAVFLVVVLLPLVSEIGDH